jgi:hypothetical protein
MITDEDAAAVENSRDDRYNIVLGYLLGLWDDMP